MTKNHPLVSPFRVFLLPLCAQPYIGHLTHPIFQIFYGRCPVSYREYPDYRACSHIRRFVLEGVLTILVLRIIATEPIAGKGRKIIQVNIAVRSSFRAGYITDLQQSIINDVLTGWITDCDCYVIRDHCMAVISRQAQNIGTTASKNVAVATAASQGSNVTVPEPSP